MSAKTPRDRISLAKNWPVWLGVILAVILLALFLAGVSTGFHSLRGWGSFIAVLALGCGILWLGWWLLRREAPPRWLGLLLVGAAVLRLAAGVVWFVALPVAGHGSSPEQSGYVMSDAQGRDQAAWQLASSKKPVWQAFSSYRKADQYGGLLFASALLYRTLGSDYHQPLLIIIVTAAFSALAILFTWAFTRRAWGDHAAWLAAWILALYPEAILLGSSQMREAFSITLIAAAMYGFIRFTQDHSLVSLGWVLGALLLNLPVSPPFTALMVAILILMTLVMAKSIFGEQLYRRFRIWLVAGGVVLLVVIGLWLSLRQFSPKAGANLLAVAGYWIRKSAEWQAYLSKHASGWIQKIFNTTPTWTHMPLLLGYGVVQPFLPAALITPTEAPIWRWIGIWRAMGWAVLLPFLIYAPLRAWRHNQSGDFARGLSLAVWLAILTASYRGGGDLWDNPRYRLAFASLQVALVAWAWTEQRRAADPWLRRALVSVALILAWFLPWYLQRYLQLPVGDLFKTFGLGVASAVLYIVWDWARQDPKRQAQKPPKQFDE
jgi:hypothetical protein